MGRYVKQCWGHDEAFMREYTICSINADMAAKVGFPKDTPLSIHMFEIIGTPVKESSADWALYQMMQGECVCHVKAPSIKYHRSTHYVKRVVMENCTDDMSDAVWMEGADPTGWQIYKKPEHESQYKVGDWVEWCGDQYMVKSAPPQSGDRYNIRSPYDELGWSVYPENITRKLSPSEIVVRIGCLSGTIAKSSDPNYFLMLHSRPATDCNHSMIRFSAIDTQTLSLVESLLKAQEEE